MTPNLDIFTAIPKAPDIGSSGITGVDSRCGGNFRAKPENYPHIQPRPQKFPKNPDIAILVWMN
jgi:hypothetical protein